MICLLLFLLPHGFLICIIAAKEYEFAQVLCKQFPGLIITSKSPETSLYLCHNNVGSWSQVSSWSSDINFKSHQYFFQITSTLFSYDDDGMKTNPNSLFCLAIKKSNFKQGVKYYKRRSQFD